MAGIGAVVPGTLPATGGWRAWTVWAMAVAYVIFLFSFQSGYSIVNPSMRQDIGLSVTQVGLVAATYTWSFALFQLFSGALLDRLGLRAVIPPAIALFTVGVFVFAQAGNMQMLVLAQVVLALGACVGFVGAGYAGGRWFGMAKFSFMFGLVQCLASLFSAFNQNLLGMALKDMPWRELFNWIGVGGVVLCIVSWLVIRDPAPVASASGNGPARLLRDLMANIADVAKIGRVWVAAMFGGFVFGALLSMGVVWAPKLMLLRGLTQDSATMAASLLWLGLAAGCIAIPWWSDVIRRRKLPTLAGIAIQLSALALLVYVPDLGIATLMVLWFAFGAGAAAHMLAFSMAGDIVRPAQIGTSAAIVNGTMFLVTGALIARPGGIASEAVSAGLPVTLELAAQASRPLLLGLIAAFVLAALLRETYPARPSPE